VDLVFIYGPAAAGKLTVAREVGKLTGWPVFHNHLVVDAVSTVFGFGTESFVRLRHEMWMAVFEEAAKIGRSLIFTFAPEKSVPPDFPDEVIAVIGKYGGRVLFVQLECPLEELENRMENASRAEFRKLRSVELWRTLRAEGSQEFPPLPDSGLTIDTSQVQPSDAAKRIVEFYDLLAG